MLVDAADSEDSAGSPSVTSLSLESEPRTDWFEARIDRVEITQDPGVAMVALDARGDEIGRLSLSPGVEGNLLLRHEYLDGSMQITVRAAPGTASLGTTEVTQNLPDVTIARRARVITDVYISRDLAGSRLACVLTIAASAAACFATPPPWVAGTCPAAVYVTICACRDEIKNTVDFDFSICDELD